jgi:hypothetical protein
MKIAIGASDGYAVCKNLSDTTNIQYAFFWDTPTMIMSVRLENATVASSAAGSVPENVWCNVGFIWNGINVKVYINLVQSGATGAFSGTLTTRPTINIGKREINAAYLKGDIATVTIYAGVKAIEANILKAERAISKVYL